MRLTRLLAATPITKGRLDARRISTTHSVENDRPKRVPSSNHSLTRYYHTPAHMLSRPAPLVWPVLSLILSVVGICHSRTLPPPTHTSSERPTVERLHPNPDRPHRIEHKPRDLEHLHHTANTTFKSILSSIPAEQRLVPSKLQHASLKLKDLPGSRPAIAPKDDISSTSRLRRCCCKFSWCGYMISAYFRLLLQAMLLLLLQALLLLLL